MNLKDEIKNDPYFWYKLNVHLIALYLVFSCVVGIITEAKWILDFLGGK